MREAKPVLAANEARQVADHHAVRKVRALRWARRSAGVDQHGAVVSLRLHCVEFPRLLLQLAFIRQIRLRARFADANKCAQCGAARTHFLHVRNRLLIADRNDSLAVLQAIFQRLGPEQDRQRHRDGAHLENCHVGNRGLEALRHHHRHAVTSLDAQRHEHIAQRIGAHLQFQVRQELCARARPVGADRRALDRVGLARPARAAHLGNIEVRWHVPAEGCMHARVVVAGLTHANCLVSL